jgi:hypothetical protein
LRGILFRALPPNLTAVGFFEGIPAAPQEEKMAAAGNPTKVSEPAENKKFF